MPTPKLYVQSYLVQWAEFAQLLSLDRIGGSGDVDRLSLSHRPVFQPEGRELKFYRESRAILSKNNR